LTITFWLLGDNTFYCPGTLKFILEVSYFRSMENGLENNQQKIPNVGHHIVFKPLLALLDHFALPLPIKCCNRVVKR